MSSSTRYNELISKIKAGQYDQKQLLNLLENATRLDNVEVVEAVRLQMRRDFPSAATKHFGAKGEDAKIKLEETISILIKEFDLSNNRTRSKNIVKVGGDRISGETYIDYYISYKNEDGYAVVLGLIQKDIDADLNVRFVYYKTGKDSFKEEQIFPISDYEMALNMYKNRLSEIVR